MTLQDSKKHRKCSKCGKEFSTRQAANQHIEMKHHGKAERIPVVVREYEPSIAELMIDAQLARACGEPIEEWLENMLP